MRRLPRWIASTLLLLSPWCHAYQQAHWQTGFPLPLTGKGAALVSQQTAFLLKQRDHLQQRIRQAQPMIRWVEQQSQERQLPSLLAFVPLIESSYRLDVVSHAGAAGPWQLMPEAAARFAIPMTAAFDGRYSLPLATEAALSYLGWLYQFFGQDWLLALAAYNAGEGRVLNAVLKAGTRNLWELALPQETHLYVARLLALSNLLAKPEQYQFQLPAWQEGTDLQVLRHPDHCSLLDWALTKGVPMNEASRWNPAWQLPDATGVSNCPIVYRAPSRPSSIRPVPWAAHHPQPHHTVTRPSGKPLLHKAISLESLHDPLLLAPTRGLDMGKNEVMPEQLAAPLLQMGTRRPRWAP